MDISAMDPKDIPGLFDAEVVGPDGEKVGTIQQIFADEVTGAATFVTVLSQGHEYFIPCLLYTSPSPRDLSTSRMPSSA